MECAGLVSATRETLLKGLNGPPRFVQSPSHVGVGASSYSTAPSPPPLSRPEHYQSPRVVSTLRLLACVSSFLSLSSLPSSPSRFPTSIFQ